MNSWKICYIGNNVEKWLDDLTNEQLKSVAKELKLLALCGNTLKMPHAKYLKDSIYELRERRFGYRIYYCFEHNNILMLNAGNKKSQIRDITLALKIKKETQNEKQ